MHPPLTSTAEGSAGYRQRHGPLLGSFQERPEIHKTVSWMCTLSTPLKFMAYPWSNTYPPVPHPPAGPWLYWQTHFQVWPLLSPSLLPLRQHHLSLDRTCFSGLSLIPGDGQLCWWVAWELRMDLPAFKGSKSEFIKLAGDTTGLPKPKTCMLCPLYTGTASACRCCPEWTLTFQSQNNSFKI